MIKEIYILWNNKDNRPAVSRNYFGALCCYPTLAQAQAYLADWFFYDKSIKEEYEIKKIIVTE